MPTEVYEDEFPPPGSSWYRLVSSHTDDIPQRHMTYRRTISVEASDDLDPAIFVYLALSLPDGEEARFDRVASPSDLEELPVGAPLPDAEERFFRLDSVDLLFRSSEEMQQVWESIQEDVQSLAAALRNLTNTQPEAEHFFPVSE